MLSAKLNRTLRLMLCTCIVSFNQFITGASFIFSSILLAKLKEPTTPIKINREDASWIASVPVLVCPIGLLLIGLLSDKIGRIKALQIAYIPLIISWLLLANANTLKAIIIGRAIMGTTLGSCTCIVYLYLAEVCPTNYRPLCSSICTVFVGIGMMSTCMFAMVFHWQTVSIILFVMSTAGCVSLFALPETPVWLRTNGRVSDAEKSEKWLGIDQPAAGTGVDDDRGAGNVDGAADIGKPSYWAQFVYPTVWKPTLITLAFFACQQGSGLYVLLFYSVDVLRDCRVQWDGITVTMFLSIARVVGSSTFSALHHVRRKTLTVVSSSGMAMSLIAIIAYTRTYKQVVDPPYGMFPIMAFVSYMFFAMLAMLPLPWAICGELFPMSVKGTMSGIVQICGYELMFVVNKVYPSLVSKYGIENVWAVFAVFCLVSAFYGAFIIPETKGKSLNEILKSFESQQKSIKNNLP